MPLGTGHLWLVLMLLGVVLVIWGPSKLPEMGSGLGHAIKEFRRATSGEASAPAPAPVAVPLQTEATAAPVAVGHD